MHLPGCVTTTLNRSSRSSVPDGQNSTHIRQPLQNWRMMVCRWPFGPTDEIGSLFRNFFTPASACAHGRENEAGPKRISLLSGSLFYRGGVQRQLLPPAGAESSADLADRADTRLGQSGIQKPENREQNVEAGTDQLQTTQMTQIGAQCRTDFGRDYRTGNRPDSLPDSGASNGPSHVEGRRPGHRTSCGPENRLSRSPSDRLRRSQDLSARYHRNRLPCGRTGPFPDRGADDPPDSPGDNPLKNVAIDLTYGHAGTLGAMPAC